MSEISSVKQKIKALSETKKLAEAMRVVSISSYSRVSAILKNVSKMKKVIERALKIILKKNPELKTNFLKVEAKKKFKGYNFNDLNKRSLRKLQL